MNNVFIITVLLIVVVVFLLISIFNSLKRKRNQIENAISSLDALFIKRADLIPNLIKVVKQYTEYEKATLDKITQLRQPQGNEKQKAYQGNTELDKMMKNLMIQVENYPDLKANTQFTQLQYSWNEAEEQIAAGRRYLAASITDYNDAIMVFPNNVIAGMFNFSAYKWQYATDSQRQRIEADDHF